MTPSRSSNRRWFLGEREPSIMERTLSNLSSASSGIRVASMPRQAVGAKQSTSPSVNAPSKSPRAKTSIVSSRMLSIRFASAQSKQRLRQIINSNRARRTDDTGTTAPTNATLPIDDSIDKEGRNGTYSKEYTLKHPEITWTHRGQGRYVPRPSLPSLNTSKVGHGFPAVKSSPENARTESAVNSKDFRDMVDKMFSALAMYRNDIDPYAPTWAGTSIVVRQLGEEIEAKFRSKPRRLWPRIIGHLQPPVVRNVMKKWHADMLQLYPLEAEVIELPEAVVTEPTSTPPSVRRSRLRQQQSSPHQAFQVEARRSTRLLETPIRSFAQESTEEEDEDEHDEEPDQPDDGTDDLAVIADDLGSIPVDDDDHYDPSQQTYKKSYVDAHPEQEFHHTGNGWYKRGSKQYGSSASKTSRPLSPPTFKIENDRQASFDATITTIHSKDLHKYPGETFHHTGNGWYRPGVGPHGQRASLVVDRDGGLLAGPRLSQKSNETGSFNDVNAAASPDDVGGEGTVDKAYTLLHPDVEWVHRGAGRYRRKSSAADTATTAIRRTSRVSRVTADEAVDDDEDAEDQALRPGRRQRRLSRPRLASTPSNLSAPDQLFDKAYVDAHPHEKFHHRGQGRWARGDRPRPPPSSTESSEDSTAEILVDSAYVYAHPNETFHHRGQGKWARGLPPPGSSNKVAVRGPGAKERSESTSHATEETDEYGNKPPGPNELVRREEGPDRWPNLKWVYRGGGKWCRTAKEEPVKVIVVRRARPSTSTTQRTAPPPTLRQEVSARRELPAPDASRAARAHRRRVASLQHAGSKGSSQNSPSKANTPRPALLSAEEDRLTDEDLPSLYKEQWSSDSEADVDAEVLRIMRDTFQPLTGAEPFVTALTKFDPAVRSLASLKALASNAQSALEQLQTEYMELDKRVAIHPMNGKKERKPVRGGRALVEHQVYEDKKEALLYDYTYDPRKIGFQNPDTQRIIRDAEGRELRRRRNRQGIDLDPSILEAANMDGDDSPARRAIRPTSRFDGAVVPPPRKRTRLTESTVADIPASSIESRSSDLALAVNLDDVRPTRQTRDHVPKRIRELRGDSVGLGYSTPEQGSPAPPNNGGSGRSRDNSSSSAAAAARKGRPPGSKNLHRRRDAGIKKGPRKPKTDSDMQSMGLRRWRSMTGEEEQEWAPEMSAEADARYPGGSESEA